MPVDDDADAVAKPKRRCGPAEPDKVWRRGGLKRSDGRLIIHIDRAIDQHEDVRIGPLKLDHSADQGHRPLAVGNDRGVVRGERPDNCRQPARDDETLMPGIKILTPGILAPITAMLLAARFIALPSPDVQRARQVS